VILQFGERVGSVCPENPLNEAKPTERFLRPSFMDELDHLIEHAMAVFEPDFGVIEKIIMGIVDLPNTLTFKA
jgi:hypothetical protein